MSLSDPVLPLLQRFALPHREGESKVMPLGEAVRRFVRPGMTVHAAYSDARPNAALMELVRQFAGKDPRLTLVTAGLTSPHYPLLTTGVVRRVIASFAGENYPAAAPNPIFQAALAGGQVELESWSLWTLVARLAAGALGIPFFPVHSLEQSSLADEHRGTAYARVEDPFTPGQDIGVVRALRPDVVLLQGVAADPYGNVVMSAPYGESYWGALAAREGVIACVEQVVDTRALQAHSALVRIPGYVVRAVCPVPLGSHPYGLFNPGFPGVSGYVEDEAFIAEAQAACRDPERLRRWTEEWILGTADHRAYLAKLGTERTYYLMGKGHEAAWELEAGPEWGAAADPEWGAAADPEWGAAADPAYSSEEMTVVASARAMAGRIRAAGLRTVLAGVGQSNLAAWLAVTRLKQAGYDVELMAEIGIFGYTPRPGEPFIFANRNLPTCKMMTDVMGVLGVLLSGAGGRALGVVGAGQIDQFGNVNSSRTADGGWLVGSGGGNDIASAAAEVLVTVKHSRQRLVEQVPYITSPGGRVRTIVTSLGIFERDEQGFVLTAYLPGAGDTAAAAVAAIGARTGWPLRVAPGLRAEAPPEPEELQLIRLYDPRRTFLGQAPSGGKADV